MTLTKKNPQFKRESNVIPMEKGRLPPQALKVEQAVLCGILIDRTSFDRIDDILEPEMFYLEEHGLIFSAATNLNRKGSVVDLKTVTEQLIEDGSIDKVGGVSKLIKLSQKVSSSAHIEHHARIIQEKHILRSLIEVSSNIIEKSYDETNSVFDTVEYAETKIYEATKNKIKTQAVKIDKLFEELTQRLENQKNHEGLNGVETGFSELDKITSGFQPSDLVVLAARPGMGKTAFMLSMARNIAVEKEVPVAIFSLEMSSMQVMTRFVSAETNIPINKVRDGTLDSDQWNEIYEKSTSLGDAPIFIDETPQLSIYELRSKVRRLYSEHNIGIIMVDYLQLMTVSERGRHQNREQTISTISSTLKGIAKELDIPVVALSQLNRAVERRDKSRPQLSDLRESGAIEQDADIVAFLYRPEYYNMDHWEDGTPTENEAEIIISKHRNGATGQIRIGFNAPISKFTNDRPELGSIYYKEQYKLSSKMNDDKPYSDGRDDVKNPDEEEPTPF